MNPGGSGTEWKRPLPVVVTGASGFIGRAVCRALLEAGASVRAAVRSVHSAERLVAGTEAVVIGDLAGNAPLAPSVARAGAIVHLAARVHVMHDRGLESLEAYRRLNVHATVRLATAAADAGVRRFVYVSSVKAVGERSVRPLTEDAVPAPEDAYGRTKLEAEHALQAVAERTGLEVVVLRPPLVYGPGVGGNFRRLVSLVRLAHHVPLPLAGDNARSLVFVVNLADALVRAVLHPGAAGQTFFVRDSVDVSTRGLLERLGAAIGLRPKLFHAPAPLLRAVFRAVGREGELERLMGTLQVDDAHLRRTLGWAAPVPMDDALVLTARALAAARAP